MKEIRVDIAIIGGGTAGMSAFRGAKHHTDSILMIEGDSYGTTCAKVGCMPSKLLIAAAESVHAIQQAPQFGVQAKSIQIDGKEVMQRVKSERDRFVGFVLDAINDIPEKYKLKGHAHFIDDHTLQIDNHSRIIAKNIVIATGSTPLILPQFSALGDRMVINDNIFDWDDLPESVAVFGPGVIGLEIGQALHRLGVRIKMFGITGTLGPISDPDILDYALKTFQAEFYLDHKAKLSTAERVGDQVKVTYINHENKEKVEHFEYALVAIGRIPNIKSLKLENTSLTLDKKGMPSFNQKTMQIQNSPIFIAGDANNKVPLLHEASDEGRLAGKNAALYPNIELGKRRSPLSIVFTDPQISMVGYRYSELPHSCFVTGSASFENQGRSRVILKNKGLLHIYAEAGTYRFLGAEMVGPAAEHIAHLLSWAHQQNLTIPQMLEMPFYHPTIEEGVRTALRDAHKKLKLAPEKPTCFEHI